MEILMNKRLIISFMVLSLGVLPSYAEEQGSVETDPEMSRERGYFFGFSLGENLKQLGNGDVDQQQLLEGLADALEGKSPRLDAAQQQAVIKIINLRQEQQQAKQQAAADNESTDNLAIADSFLEENGSRPNVVTTDSGLQYEVIVEGTGSSPKETDQVTVHYEGTFLDGNVFDSSVQRGEPAKFRLNQVIIGWTEGLQLMKTGGKTRFFVHPELGYGPGGRSGIPPNALLIFEVELLGID